MGEAVEKLFVYIQQIRARKKEGLLLRRTLKYFGLLRLVVFGAIAMPFTEDLDCLADPTQNIRRILADPRKKTYLYICIKKVLLSNAWRTTFEMLCVFDCGVEAACREKKGQSPKEKERCVAAMQEILKRGVHNTFTSLQANPMVKKALESAALTRDEIWNLQEEIETIEIQQRRLLVLVNEALISFPSPAEICCDSEERKTMQDFVKHVKNAYNFYVELKRHMRNAIVLFQRHVDIAANTEKFFLLRYFLAERFSVQEFQNYLAIAAEKGLSYGKRFFLSYLLICVFLLLEEMVVFGPWVFFLFYVDRLFFLFSRCPHKITLRLFEVFCAVCVLPMLFLSFYTCRILKYIEVYVIRRFFQLNVDEYMKKRITRVCLSIFSILLFLTGIPLIAVYGQDRCILCLQFLLLCIILLQYASKWHRILNVLLFAGTPLLRNYQTTALALFFLSVTGGLVLGVCIFTTYLSGLKGVASTLK